MLAFLSAGFSLSGARAAFAAYQEGWLVDFLVGSPSPSMVDFWEMLTFLN